MKKTGAANISITKEDPRRDPKVSRKVPMKKRPRIAPRTAHTPDEAGGAMLGQVNERGRGRLAYSPERPISVFVRLRFSRMTGIRAAGAKVAKKHIMKLNQARWKALM
jgi:hypothetical protein